MCATLKPLAPLEVPEGQHSIFLAGSIASGAADMWQDRLIDALNEEKVTFLNPRRDAWDSSWEQSIDNPQFREQVEWELAGLEIASTIAMYFAPEAKAPITLLELGLYARSGRLIVCCPDGFWRKGNVDVVCSTYGIPQVGKWEHFVDAVRQATNQ